jgi:molybdate transport system regulatory protein
MKISARNQLKGTVTKINEGAVNGIVTIDVNGCAVSATISMDSIKGLGLEVGKEAYAVIKATEVMIGLGEMKLSARNQFAGKITAINKGAVNAIVTLEACGGNVLSSTISLAAVEELGLEVGKEAFAVIKATSVMVAVD